MRLPNPVRLYLLGIAQGVMASRPPDLKINGEYVHRWMFLKKSNPLSKLFNIYIHRFQGDDEDGALHDHEPDNISLILDGGYREHFHKKLLEVGYYIENVEGKSQFTPRYRTMYKIRMPGDIVFRFAGTPHRITLFVLVDQYRAANGPKIDFSKRHPVITMFIQGPRRRRWGFHCVNGWKPWQQYIDVQKSYGDRSGKGCGE